MRRFSDFINIICINRIINRIVPRLFILIVLSLLLPRAQHLLLLVCEVHHKAIALSADTRDLTVAVLAWLHSFAGSLCVVTQPFEFLLLHSSLLTDDPLVIVVLRFRITLRLVFRDLRVIGLINIWRFVNLSPRLIL